MQTLEDNIKWVQDFNLNLGVNVLGGLFDVLETFVDPVNLLQAFYDIIERGDELRQAYGGGTEKFKIEIRKYLQKVSGRLPVKSFNVLTIHYVPFYYEGYARLKHNQEFIDWIKKTEFSIMPDIFSKYVLLYAISKIEISNKIASTVLDTMREIENESFMRETDRTPNQPPKKESIWIQHEDGSAAMHTADGARIDYARPGPSQMDRLMADAAAKATLEEWRKSRPSAPWYAPMLGVAIWVAVLGALLAVFLLGVKWYLGVQGM